MKSNLKSCGKKLESFLNKINVLLPNDSFDLKAEKGISPAEFFRRSIEKKQ